ncbi:MAG: tetratricopeptide repeat protein [Fidelibacterota bacterium]|nr:MAG: tetratricopeptide repeat protein [Candidatus Neomarinimicrobiota bacterium]
MTIIPGSKISEQFTILRAVWGLFLALVIGSCGTSSIYIIVKRPAEINLKEYRKIAIGDITGQHGRKDSHANDLADEITSVLFTSGQFEVLDRQHLARIMDEYSLSETGIIDESTAPEIGRIVGTAALIFGRIQTDEYTEDMERGKPYKDKQGRSHQINTRKGTYTMSANLQVIDIQTARILAVKSLSARHTARRSADKRDPASIDRNALYSRCVKEISGKFMRMVAPYDAQVRAAFMTDKLLPEVDQAISFFRIGEWEDGMVLLRGTIGKSGLPGEVQAKAFYNLGLAETYAGQFDTAIEHLKTALSLNPKSKRIQDAIIRAKMEQENAERLQEQL